MNRSIEISSGTIFRTILIVLAFWFVYTIREIVAIGIFAIIIASAMDPIVDWFQKRKIPRAITVLGLYITGFSIVAVTFSLLIPPIIAELKSLIEQAPGTLAKLSSVLDKTQSGVGSQAVRTQMTNFFGALAGKFSEITPSIFSGTISFISGFFYLIVILSLAFYMSLEEKALSSFIGSLVPHEHREYVTHLIQRIQYKLGRWLNSQFLVMFVVFALDYIGLMLLGIPYALVFALTAGLLEIIPYFGPVISAFIPVLVGFSVSPVSGILVLTLFVLVQQFESNVFVPLIMKKVIGLNPIAIILAILIGGHVAGVMGILLAVPVAAALSEVIKDLTEKRNRSVEKKVLTF